MFVVLSGKLVGVMLIYYPGHHNKTLKHSFFVIKKKYL